jgi:hypothetical protein
MRKNAWLLVCLGMGSATAFADDATAPAMAPMAPAAAPAPAATSSTTTAPADGWRLRHGITATLGEEFGSVQGASFSAALYGVDWRLGVQLNDNIAVYSQAHLSFGSGQVNGLGGSTGTFAEALMGEYTINDKIFVGGGAGYGVLNNPSGPLIAARAGYYPMMKRDEVEPRRRGLVISGDLREYFVDSITVTQLMFSVGYEKY